jgi:hypothetical protein
MRGKVLLKPKPGNATWVHPLCKLSIDEATVTFGGAATSAKLECPHSCPWQEETPNDASGQGMPPGTFFSNFDASNATIMVTTGTVLHEDGEKAIAELDSLGIGECEYRYLYAKMEEIFPSPTNQQAKCIIGLQTRGAGWADPAIKGIYINYLITAERKFIKSFFTNVQNPEAYTWNPYKNTGDLNKEFCKGTDPIWNQDGVIPDP